MIATIEHTPDGPTLLVYGVRVAEKPVGDPGEWLGKLPPDWTVIGSIADLLRDAERAKRLQDAGDRMLALVSRCSDQATEDQLAEHARFVAALRQIWRSA